MPPRAKQPRAKEKTPARIKDLKHRGGAKPIKGEVGRGPALHGQIGPSGAKSWVLCARYGEWAETTLTGGKIQRGRKTRDIGRCAYPDVLPCSARPSVGEVKLEAGIDPAAERKAAQAALIASARRGCGPRRNA